MRWATPWLTPSESRTRRLLRPTTGTCRCSSPADRRSISVRSFLTLAPSRSEVRSRPQYLAPGSVALPYELGELAFKSGHSSFELVHAVAERCDLALDELPRAVAHPLIDLGRCLLERLARESIIEHVSSSGTGRHGTRSILTSAVR